MKKKGKKQTFFLRAAMMVLTTILIVLFFAIMSMVGKIQGTARVINYAGLVRGGTQQMVKFEISGTPQDKMYQKISSYIEGLRNGSDELNFVCLDDQKFQRKMDELAGYFEELRDEILLVREKGYENTDIIEKSEIFFRLCDEAVGLSEEYSQRKATALDYLEKVVIVDILGLVLIIGAELIKAVRFAAQNKVLQKKVYFDEATGLPNKNKCEEILNDPNPIPDGEQVAMCVFDMNNLRTINNTLGHDKGDEYICSFAIQLRKAVPDEFFAGRDGGDEFIAVLKGLDHAGVRECLKKIREQSAEYSRQHPEMPISYAAGYALSSDFEGSTMRELFRFADKNMYIDKNRAKIEEAAEKQKMNIRILEEITEKGYQFSDCIYCDALLDQYYVLRASSGFFLAEDGSYSGAVEQIIQELDEGMRKQFSEKFGEIQKEFDKAFKELFGGGKGTLELDEEADILEAGIKIISQPPGKKLQNMMQLSGGEKALTAIALLFAIQNLKPSPFCLLDEIEAALDDSNVGRFAGYLQKLTKNTQFIIITHRRGTMNAADRLYGITMQEKGVSTLVSVDLVENQLTQ